MKVELQGAKVELDVRDGVASLMVNGEKLPIPREVAVRLVFGESKPGLAKTTPKPARGCQTAASKRKLSASLRKFYAKKRRQENAGKTVSHVAPKKSTANSKLNGIHLSN